NDQDAVPRSFASAVPAEPTSIARSHRASLAIIAREQSADRWRQRGAELDGIERCLFPPSRIWIDSQRHHDSPIFHSKAAFAKRPRPPRSARKIPKAHRNRNRGCSIPFASVETKHSCACAAPDRHRRKYTALQRTAFKSGTG